MMCSPRKFIQSKPIFYDHTYWKPERRRWKKHFTMLLANYLTLYRRCKVTVIDMDYQQSIAQKYQRAKLLENVEPYEVIAAGLEDYPRLLPVLSL
ncbi:hypothetical protein [Pedobacter sp. GR22-6]|uniref:hypothetical protein n=1 Tax=Pedobacter sp. GR22-6 TaxID=3127957 RepID=UPI00307ECB53